MSTKTVTSARAVTAAITNLQAAQDDFVAAAGAVARTRVARAIRWAQVAETMGGFTKRGVPTRMATETGFSKALLYVMRDDHTALGALATKIDLPLIADTARVDYSPERWTGDLDKAAAIMVKVYGKRADDKRAERKEAKEAKEDSTKGQTSDGPTETVADVKVPTVEDVTKEMAKAVEVLGMFTSGAGLTKAQAKALRTMLTKAEALIAGATV
jgi:hypothetical protein